MPDRVESSKTDWRQSTFWPALVGSTLYWAALPLVNLWPLAWLAPAPLVWLALRKELSGRRPYRMLWFVGFLFWLATLYFLTLPYWALCFGWLALSAYLAVYWPLFVGLTRVAVHQFGVSAILAAPIVWTGLELARAHLFGGFLMAALGHTQYRWIRLIQISDLGGAYAVSFLMVLVAACLARMFTRDGNPAKRALWPVVPAAAALIATLAYGHLRIAGEHTRPGARVALIQGSIDVDVSADPTQRDRILQQYLGLSRKAVGEHKNLDLMIWPESMFHPQWLSVDADAVWPADAEVTVDEAVARNHGDIERTVRSLGVPALIGIDCVRFASEKREFTNSAMFFQPDGRLLGRYDKCQLVMFGEYIPFADWFPLLYDFLPMGGGLTPGAAPASVKIGALRYSPTICYESTVPHLVRGQLQELRNRHEEPDVLVNLTNDGWFWGSNELDLHLVCGVFRAVECRKPLVIAANTGFSASINAQGEILDQGPRRATDVIVADIDPDDRYSPYVEFGDLPAGLSLAVCVSLGLAGGWRRRTERRANPTHLAQARGFKAV